ncbi:MAG: heavy metal sensor histidine kinase [Acidobacteriota bacterium]|nr:heavy metal sensor histidine kinase [Acidobacteriota bacterium]
MNAKSRIRAGLFGSMRSQLTIWYSGVLALVLLIFAVTTYSYLAQAARQRTDDSLADTLNSFISNFNTELDDESHSAEDAAKEAARGFHFRDRQVIVFDGERNAVVASDTAENFPHGPKWFTSAAAQPQLSNLMDSASRTGRSYTTVFKKEHAIRVFAAAVPSGRQTYLFAVTTPLREQDQALAQARKAFYVAIPLALLLASLGGYFLARKSLSPVVSMGEQAARIGASNLNERIPVPQNNEELGRLARIFNDLLLRLDQSFAQQKRFMADASHELRTPVAVIRGESEVTLSQPSRDEKEYRESLAIVNDEGQRLTRMVEDLFILARADAGEYPLVLTDFYLDESMNECVRSMRSLAAQKDLEVLYQAPEKEIGFRGDEPLIRRMVLNLLHNAIKYTPKNGRVRVSLRDNLEHCEVVISDTGRGIPPEAQSRVFERFFRVDKARSRDESLNGSGAGLGLSIARWAAEMHGGKIILDRSDGSGTTFVISLPSPRGSHQ